jgi:hypothetical protein
MVMEAFGMAAPVGSATDPLRDVVWPKRLVARMKEIKISPRRLRMYVSPFPDGCPGCQALGPATN